MRRPALCFVFLLAFAAGSACGQVVMPSRDSATPPRENVFGLGLFGGAASGLGLSFRHHLPSPFSYQITGGIIKVDDRLSYSIGAEAQYDLARTGVTRFFVTGGTAYFHAGKSSRNDMEGPGRLGVGVGGEFHAQSGIHGTLELMFTYFDDGTVLPLPQIGFHYYFR